MAWPGLWGVQRSQGATSKESLNITEIRRVNQRHRKLHFISKVYYPCAFAGESGARVISNSQS